MKHAIHLTAAAASALLVPRYPHLATILLVSSLPEPADAGRAGKGKKTFYAIHGGQNAGIYDEYNNHLANHQSVDHKWFETYEEAAPVPHTHLPYVLRRAGRNTADPAQWTPCAAGNGTR